MFYVSLIWSDI